MQAQEKISEFIAAKPGVRVLKAGTSDMADLAIRCDFPGLKSQIVEFPITDSEKPLTTGRFTIQKSADLPFDYEFLELKVVISGSIRVKDSDGVIHQADAGDVIVFTPPASVVFLGDSEGEAVYVAHRAFEPMFGDGEEKPSALSVKPGIQLIKAGTPKTVEVGPKVALPDHKSQIIDIPISEASRPLSLGRFAMQPSIDFPFLYEYLEVKVILKGKICVKDEQGVKYEATPGDVYVFTPQTEVTFLAESDGEAVYAGHREPEPLFLLL
ncbi:hypothetical protein [Myxosarcina sp. GI1]|uniref:hypothetical protein n=1 Tax=Myxosarcina sp. GI1 TaxID=1541065 RepID=UPI001C127035|nr:hypothetical protein [Myxosarcina sp. GI1]